MARLPSVGQYQASSRERGVGRIYFGLEAGGTKCVCLVAAGPGAILARQSIPTTTPAETLAVARRFFESQGGAPEACGVASFGPVRVSPADPGYGRLARTPKPGWDGADMLSPFASFAGPKACDTDVAAAALAEQCWGAGRDVGTLVYVTVGTGIGAGVVKDGRSVRGAWHLEAGHYFPQRAPDDPFVGVCAFHGACLEGLASGPAIQARWGKTLSELPQTHPAHALEADYLAQLCLTLALTHAPERILLGGGVMQTPGLLARVRSRAGDLLAGYAPWPAAARLQDFICAPGLGEQAGPLGAIALAVSAAGGRVSA